MYSRCCFKHFSECWRPLFLVKMRYTNNWNLQLPTVQWGTTIFQLDSPSPLMVAKFNFKTHLQNMFRSRFTSKFTKCANMTKPTFLLNFADFESVEKIAKKSCEKNYQWKSDRKSFFKTFITVCKSFASYYIFCVNFLEFFSTESNSASNFAFYDPHLKKTVLLLLALLLTLKPKANETAKKIKTLYYQCVLESILHPYPESVATVPPFSPIEGQKWFDQISSQWESQKNRFALIYFGKIQFLPPCIWNLPFMSTASVWEASICKKKSKSFWPTECTLYSVQPPPPPPERIWWGGGPKLFCRVSSPEN